MRKLILLSVFFLFLTACTDAAIEPPAATEIPTVVPDAFFVAPDVSMGEISPLVYGTNYGPWVIVPARLIPEAEEAGITVIRFPGGEYGDRNKIQPYQLDQAVAFATQMGAELNIQVNLLNGTPEDAAEMVRYMNVEKGYRVRFWTIGNEPSLYDGFPDKTYDTEIFNREWRAFAEAMRAVDPEIKLLGPEIHQFASSANATPKDSAGRDWMVEFLRANGDLVDIVSVHVYPFPQSRVSDNASVEDLYRDTQKWDPILEHLKALIAEHTGKDLPIAFTEINSHWSHATGGEATPDSFYNAIWWGDVLGRFIRGDVYLVNHWLLASKPGQGSWGLFSSSEPRPSYYVYRMYRLLGSERVYATSDDSYLTITAALRPDGALTLLIINPGEVTVQRRLQVQGMDLTTAERWLFDASHNAENTGAIDLSGGNVTLPPQSISVFIIDG